MPISGLRSGTAAGKGNATEVTARWAGRECAGAQRIRSVPGSVALLLLLPILAVPQDPPPVEKQPPQDQDPKPRLDLYGDPLPEGAVARMGTLRFRESQGIHHIAFSPDLRLVATASYKDSTATLWNGETGRAWKEIDLKGFHVGPLAFSPDGKTLVIGEGGSILFYRVDGEGGPERIHFPEPGRAAMTRLGATVLHLAYSPDGMALAAATRDAIHTWNVKSGERLRRIDYEPSYWSSVVFSPDGKTLVAGCDEMKIRCWDVESGKETLEIQVPTPPRHPRFGGGNQKDCLGRIVVSPDGKVIASTGEKHGLTQRTVHLWDAGTGEKIKDIGSDSWGIHDAVFSEDGKMLATAGQDGGVQVWDWKEGRRIRSFSLDSISSVAFSRDGKRLALVRGNPGTIQIRDLATGEKVPDFHVHEGAVESVAFSPDGRTVATGGAQGEIILWDPVTSRPIRRIRGHPSYVERLRFSEDGSTLASHGWDNRLRLWDVASGASTFDVRVPIHWTPLDGSNRIEGLEQVPPQLLEHFKKKPTTFALSPNGAKLATGRPNGIVHIWNVESRKVNRRFSAHPGGVGALVFLDGGTRFVSCGSDGGLAAWETETGKEIQRWEMTGSAVRCAALSPDENVLAFGDMDGVIHIWEFISGEERSSLDGHTWGVSSLRFSPGGGRLLSRGANPREAREDERPDDVFGKYAMFKLWDLEVGREILALKAYSDWTASDMETESVYNSVAFGPDGHTLAAGGLGDDVHLFEIASGQIYRKLSGHGGSLNQVAFSPDGRTLASASYDTTSLVWDVASAAPAPPQEGEEIQIDALWETLAQEDARAAYAAVGRLVARGGEALEFLRDRLHPAGDGNREKIEKLITRLDAEDFGEREEASVALEALAEEAAPALRRELKKTTSPEVRQRILPLLRAIGPPYERFPSANLRAVRAIRVLERMGSPSARAFLGDLAAGSKWAVRTREAAAALRRLDPVSSGEGAPREF